MFFFQAEDGIRDIGVTGVQTCALPISEVDGKPTLVQPEQVNFGLAIDLPKADGSRSLVVASIKGAEEMDFAQFWGAYEDAIQIGRASWRERVEISGVAVSLKQKTTPVC